MDPIYLSLICLVLALGLAAVDLLVPSGGFLLVLACASALGAILFGFRAGTTTGMVMLTLTIGAIPILLTIALRIWPHTPLGRRIILKPPFKKSEQSSAKSPPTPETNNSRRNKSADKISMDELVGSVHVVAGPLLPTGQLKVGHRYFNATAENGFIDADTVVEVVSIRERNLIVRPTDRQLSSLASPAASVETRDDTTENQANLLEMSAEELGIDSLGFGEEDEKS